MWQRECQAGEVSASVQSDHILHGIHGYTCFQFFRHCTQATKTQKGHAYQRHLDNPQNYDITDVCRRS